MRILATFTAFWAIGCGSLTSELERIKKRYEAAHAECTPSVSVVSPGYPNAPGWLDYVRNDGTSPLSSSGVPCDGTEGGHYGACLHAGETRQAQLGCVSSCAGVTVSDALDAFHWKCVEKNSGVYAVSSGLRLEKNLSDLIDFSTASWRPNSVRIATPAGNASSSASAWWQNSIVLNAVPGTLSATGTVYAFDANPAGNFTLASDKIALVGKPRVFLNGAGSYVAATGYKFLWLEGDFQLFTDSDIAVNFTTVTNSMLRNIAVAGTGAATPTYGSAIKLMGGGGNFLLNFRGSGFGNFGIILDNSPRNTLHRISRTNGYQILLNMPGGSADNTIVIDYLGAGLAYGLINMAPGNSGGYYQNGTGAGIKSDTLNFSGGRATILSQIVVNVNGGAYDSLRLEYNTTNFSVIGDSAFAHGVTGVNASFAGSHHFFTGELLVGNNTTTNCTGAAGRGIMTGCATDGASNFNLTTGISLVASVVGPLVFNDMVNTTMATTGLSAAAPSDWLYFENRYRAWGNTLGNLAVPGNAGFCSGPCRLWDYSLRASDTVLLNRLNVPVATDTLLHRWEASTQLSCEKIKGALWQDQVCSYPGYTSPGSCTGAGGIWSTGLCSTRLLRHAQEIFFDGVGNDNGLCESGERCIYTPNIGAYQGHGNLIRIGSVNGAAAGEIQNVELYRHQTNGY